jgi:hypothetical protein
MKKAALALLFSVALHLILGVVQAGTTGDDDASCLLFTACLADAGVRNVTTRQSPAYDAALRVSIQNLRFAGAGAGGGGRPGVAGRAPRRRAVRARGGARGAAPQRRAQLRGSVVHHRPRRRRPRRAGGRTARTRSGRSAAAAGAPSTRGASGSAPCPRASRPSSPTAPQAPPRPSPRSSPRGSASQRVCPTSSTSRRSSLPELNPPNQTGAISVTFKGLYLGPSHDAVGILAARFPELGLSLPDLNPLEMTWTDESQFFPPKQFLNPCLRDGEGALKILAPGTTPLIFLEMYTARNPHDFDFRLLLLIFFLLCNSLAVRLVTGCDPSTVPVGVAN